jgi:hypothetical protein
MILVMGLFAAKSMTDDGVALANGATAQYPASARLGPIGVEVALRGRK